MDAEELVAVCHRCQSKNPMLQGDGSECVNCKQPFVFSSHTCEVLPLIEFYLDPDISDGEAIRLIQCVTVFQWRSIPFIHSPSTHTGMTTTSGASRRELVPATCR